MMKYTREAMMGLEQITSRTTGLSILTTVVYLKGTVREPPNGDDVSRRGTWGDGVSSVEKGPSGVRYWLFSSHVFGPGKTGRTLLRDIPVVSDSNPDVGSSDEWRYKRQRRGGRESTTRGPLVRFETESQTKGSSGWTSSALSLFSVLQDNFFSIMKSGKGLWEFIKSLHSPGVLRLKSVNLKSRYHEFSFPK